MLALRSRCSHRSRSACASRIGRALAQQAVVVAVAVVVLIIAAAFGLLAGYQALIVHGFTPAAAAGIVAASLTLLGVLILATLPCSRGSENRRRQHAGGWRRRRRHARSRGGQGHPERPPGDPALDRLHCRLARQPPQVADARGFDIGHRRELFLTRLPFARGALNSLGAKRAWGQKLKRLICNQ